MREQASFFPVVRSIAETGLRAQKRKDGDFVGTDGLLYCGKCGRPRQMIKAFPNPSETDPERMTDLKVAISCLCDRQEREQKKREEQAKRDMEAVRSLRSASLMDERMTAATFGHFEMTKQNERNLRLCKRYAEHFEEMLAKNQGLLLWGDVGTGKSFAAACIANYLLERKVPVIMTSFVKLIAALEADRSRCEQIISNLNRAQLVIFDDLGAERGTDTAIEKVYSIVDSRYRRELPMIITTNRSMNEMKTEPDIRYSRIYDRLFEVCYPMQFADVSWRKRAAARSWNEMGKLLEG